jgi:hypothetical protein
VSFWDLLLNLVLSISRNVTIVRVLSLIVSGGGKISQTVKGRAPAFPGMEQIMISLPFTASSDQRRGVRTRASRCWLLLALMAVIIGGPLEKMAHAQGGILGHNCCFPRRVGLHACSLNCPGYLPRPPRGCALGPGCGCTPHAGCLGHVDKPPTEVELDAPGDLEIPPLPSDDDPFADDRGIEGVGASFGATARTADVSPNMIGDFFGGGQQMFLPSLGSDFLAVLPVGGGDRRMKLSENNSPFPTDRVFMNFNHFQNAVRDVNGREFSLQRYTFGAEKTFFEGRSSAELRLPFAYGLDASQEVGNPGRNSATELGNLALIYKQTLLRNEQWAIAAGLALTFPTADQAVITGGDNMVRVANESYHLLPYLGVYYNPSERFWTLLFVQADFDTQGNRVTFSGPAFDEQMFPPDVPRGGVLQDQSVLFLDIAWGYWLYRDACPGRWISGIAPIVELHYSTAMQDGDIVFSPRGDAVGSFTTYQSEGAFAGPPSGSRRLNTLNLTGALRFELASRSLLTLAAVAPLRTGDDKPFDAEVNVQYVWMY